MNKAALTGLSALSLVAIATFMVADLKGDIGFALELRIVRLAAIIQVAVAVAMSTVVFQTITGNRILTPSIMGLDALFILIQTTTVFSLGGLGYAALNANGKFAAETLLLTFLVAIVFLPVLRSRINLLSLLLAGIVLGVLFRSFTALLSRMISPNDFAVAQNASFANFSMVDGVLLLPACVLTVVAAFAFVRFRHILDVMALGRETSIGLGVNWNIAAAGMLMVVGLMVAASTALVGPVTFLGLVVVALGERIAGTGRHGPLFLSSLLVALILLVGGQTLLVHGFGTRVPIGVVIEFVGGVLFLFLLFFGRRH